MQQNFKEVFELDSVAHIWQKKIVFLFSFIARKLFTCLKKSKNKYFSFQLLLVVHSKMQKFKKAYILIKEGNYNKFHSVFVSLIEGVFGFSKWP